MPTYTIALSELSWAEFGAVRAALERNPGLGWRPTHTRVIHYLSHVFHLMHKAVDEGRKMKNAEQCALFYERSILEALQWVPPVVSRGPFKKSSYATIEERAYVAAKIRERLGIEPTEALVNQCLNAGDMMNLKEFVEKEAAKLKTGLEILTADMHQKSPEQAALEEQRKNLPAGLPATEETASSDSLANDGPTVEPDGEQPDPPHSQ